MNKIVCDKCKQSITLDIQKAYKGGGIVLKFLRCLHCGTKTLIDVTDKVTRDKQIELSFLTKELRNIMENVTDETLIRTEKIAKEIYEKEEQLLKEIKEAKAELKIKYEGEL